MSDTISLGTTLTIDLGDLGPQVQARIDSGEYGSADEVIRAALEALKREETEFDDRLRRKIKESLDDPRPDIPMDEVFDRLERKHAALMKADGLEP